jgi:hypothetical protein
MLTNAFFENVFLRKLLDKRGPVWYPRQDTIYTYIHIYINMVVDRTENENAFLRKMLDMKTFSWYPRQDTILLFGRQDG